MLAGPIFDRELLTAPRQWRHFLIRSGYVALLFVLMYTAGQATFGWQLLRNVGDIASFGTLIFQIFSIVQLTLVLFFALLFAAGNVAQEKDRKTLILLLATDLRNTELVFGKLFASLLIVAVLLAASFPIFCFVQLLGGVSTEQIGWSIAICAASAFAAGSWGSLVAFWRDKTFQTLSIGVLGTVFFLGLIEAVVGIVGSGTPAGAIIALLNPFRTMVHILLPLGGSAGYFSHQVTILASAGSLTLLAFALNAYTMARLRVWNPSRDVFKQTTEEKSKSATPTRVQHRAIWDNPVIWREICTRAYGRRIIVIKLAYVAMAAFAGYFIATKGVAGSLILGMISPAGFTFVGLALIALILVNAQAVTAFTSERDGKTLELLLVTNITAQEFIFGKLGGIAYNTKELILIPPILVGFMLSQGYLTSAEFIYVITGYLVLIFFASMLGLHAGLSFENSRSAIANSLGTMFFLFVGIFIFMLLLVEARSSFTIQFQSFLVFIGVGSIALYASLTHKNPSLALTLAAGLLPFFTFYALTQFLLSGALGACLAICVAYGFTAIAMLVPAVSDFDVALGRASMENG